MRKSIVFSAILALALLFIGCDSVQKSASPLMSPTAIDTTAIDTTAVESAKDEPTATPFIEEFITSGISPVIEMSPTFQVLPTVTPTLDPTPDVTDVPTGDPIIPVTRMYYETDSTTCMPNGPRPIPKLVIEPANATNKKVSIFSDNPDVAEYFVTYFLPKRAGVANIIATAHNGVTARYVINVNAIPESIPITELLIFPSGSPIISIGQKYNINASYKPSNAYSGNLSWTSSRPSVVEIFTSGSTLCVVRGLSRGSSVITIRSSNGVSTSVTVIVN